MCWLGAILVWRGGGGRRGGGRSDDRGIYPIRRKPPTRLSGRRGRKGGGASWMGIREGGLHLSRSLAHVFTTLPSMLPSFLSAYLVSSSFLLPSIYPSIHRAKGGRTRRGRDASSWIDRGRKNHPSSFSHSSPLLSSHQQQQHQCHVSIDVPGRGGGRAGFDNWRLQKCAVF